MMKFLVSLRIHSVVESHFQCDIAMPSYSISFLSFLFFRSHLCLLLLVFLRHLFSQRQLLTLVEDEHESAGEQEDG